MNKDFTKLFTCDTLGQIVFMLDDEEGSPVINIYFRPPEMGVCKLGLGFEDDALLTAEEKAENCFDAVIEKELVEMVNNFYQSMLNEEE